MTNVVAKAVERSNIGLADLMLKSIALNDCGMTSDIIADDHRAMFDIQSLFCDLKYLHCAFSLDNFPHTIIQIPGLRIQLDSKVLVGLSKMQDITLGLVDFPHTIIQVPGLRTQLGPDILCFLVEIRDELQGMQNTVLVLVNLMSLMIEGSGLEIGVCSKSSIAEINTHESVELRKLDSEFYRLHGQVNIMLLLLIVMSLDTTSSL